MAENCIGAKTVPSKWRPAQTARDTQRAVLTSKSAHAQFGHCSLN